MDSVIAECSRCGGKVEFQSKRGSCDTFPIDKVPIAMAKSIEGDTAFCESCNTRYRIVPNVYIDYISMRVVIDD
jgi:hypothetical protein